MGHSVGLTVRRMWETGSGYCALTKTSNHTFSPWLLLRKPSQHFFFFFKGGGKGDGNLDYKWKKQMSSQTVRFPCQTSYSFSSVLLFWLWGMLERKGLSPSFLCVFMALLCQEAVVRTTLETFAGSLVAPISTHKEHHSL